MQDCFFSSQDGIHQLSQRFKTSLWFINSDQVSGLPKQAHKTFKAGRPSALAKSRVRYWRQPGRVIEGPEPLRTANSRFEFA